MKYLTYIATFIVAGTVSAQQLAGFTFKSLSSRYDKNNDEVITKEEAPDNNAIFEHFDLNEDGEIVQDEFNEALRALNSGSDEEDQSVEHNSVNIIRNIEYASVDGESLKLDLYLPLNTTNAPLAVWIHGGAWKKGDKSRINPAVKRLSTEGYAVASINYRLKDLTIHPKNIHDCKGALRWLRAHAENYGIDPERVAVSGASAGGHLALLLALSADNEMLEGTVGGHTNQSSTVKAVINFFGPSELMVFSETDPRFKNAHIHSSGLLKEASPLTHLSPESPPVLIFHGDRDKTVPVSQSELLHKRYQEMGLESHLHILEGKGHGGAAFSDDTRYQLIKSFLDKHLGMN